MLGRLTRDIWRLNFGSYATLSDVGCLLKCFVLVLGCGALDDEVYHVLRSIWRLLGCNDCIVAEYIPSGVPEVTDDRYSPWVIWVGCRVSQVSIQLWSGMVLLVGSLRLITLWIFLVKCANNNYLYNLANRM